MAEAALIGAPAGHARTAEMHRITCPLCLVGHADILVDRKGGGVDSLNLREPRECFQVPAGAAAWDGLAPSPALNERFPVPVGGAVLDGLVPDPVVAGGGPVDIPVPVGGALLDGLVPLVLITTPTPTSRTHTPVAGDRTFTPSADRTKVI